MDQRSREDEAVFLFLSLLLLFIESLQLINHFPKSQHIRHMLIIKWGGGRDYRILTG